MVQDNRRRAMSALTQMLRRSVMCTRMLLVVSTTQMAEAILVENVGLRVRAVHWRENKKDRVALSEWKQYE
jgi:hypothetical protein